MVSSRLVSTFKLVRNLFLAIYLLCKEALVRRQPPVGIRIYKKPFFLSLSLSLVSTTSQKKRRSSKEFSFISLDQIKHTYRKVLYRKVLKKNRTLSARECSGIVRVSFCSLLLLRPELLFLLLFRPRTFKHSFGRSHKRLNHTTQYMM